MTVHAAKGLEFHAVFLSGLEEGLFPHENSVTEANGLEEERRLMYVALTRARRRLYITHSQTRMLHGQTRYSMASRFLRELPQELLKQIKKIEPVWSSATSAASKYGNSDKQYSSYGKQGQAFPSAPAKSNTASPWKIGQQVLHAKFGEGTVLQTEGHGADARVEVRFIRAGTKWLALAFAKLTAVEQTTH